jgi:hypothetical protein
MTIKQLLELKEIEYFEFGSYDNRIHNGVSRVVHPWDKINLTKAERRGKTYEELQVMRIEKYNNTEQESKQ